MRGVGKCLNRKTKRDRNISEKEFLKEFLTDLDF
jgi:hypothetical protein